MGSLFPQEMTEGILHANLGWLVYFLEWAAALIDLAAIALLMIGAIRFIVGCTGAELTRVNLDRIRKTNQTRIELGRYILAGLELFIVSDVIHTAISLQVADLVFLLILVIIRAIISFVLERELDQLKMELNQGTRL